MFTSGDGSHVYITSPLRVLAQQGCRASSPVDRPMRTSRHQSSDWESANAVPHYHKFCSRVSCIWGNRRGQHIRSAMDKPRPGKTTFVIMVSLLPGVRSRPWLKLRIL